MHRTTCLIILFFIIENIQAQRPKRVPISNTGCSVAVICFPGRFDEYFTEDSSKVYADDCEKDEITYGIYLVKLVNPVTKLSNAEDTIISYLKFFLFENGLTKRDAFKKGYHLNNDKNTRGIVESWTDDDGKMWKVKAWTNGTFIGILYESGKKEFPEKMVNAFLDGLLFPGML